MINNSIFDDMLGVFLIESVECIEGISCHIKIAPKECSIDQLMRELNNITRKGYTVSAVEISASEIMGEVKLVKLVFDKKI
ncbi:hypothetical protein [Serratia quinivorans]|uniref:hypothetical protein n=1 Tax=Serratia quinivorans TaxID=137545 RepID=UPI0021BB8A0B|nr:hypothetical protein [Serratia quinivorans]